ncbi:ThuA domain-containing protein [Pollutibacter soli]|uniref:ThuA domain-containing protein n=1 Tax=Pollutibacter soli TaxID=3034157 RepID=UPI0030134EF4
MKRFACPSLTRRLFAIAILLSLLSANAIAQPKFSVVGFFTAKQDRAHISFVHEANRFFAEQAEKNNFVYDSTDDWTNLNAEFLAKYQVILFFDTRPEAPEQRAAFEKYMKNGGAWMGFHFAGFALTPSAYPQNWDWYHNEFIGSGQYKGNTWRPTSANLKVEARKHPALKGLPKVFKSSPNEWYSWEKDITQNRDIQILLSIDSTSFPLGTGPKKHEIWHSGYYPVAWTNKKYKMIYSNMGHNDIDYEGKTNRELSYQFANTVQNKFVLNSLFWLAGVKK